MTAIKLVRSSSLESLSRLKITDEELSTNNNLVNTAYSDNSSYEFEESESSSEDADADNSNDEGRSTASDYESTAADESYDEQESINGNDKAKMNNDVGNDTMAATTVRENTNRGLPSSCIFVASLTAALSDDKLCLSVKNKFKEYGELNGVKVLRDQENRPYAFVQYTNDLDAVVALENAHGTVLDGRVIRCEPARVNRTLFISGPNKVSHIDIKRLCSSFGKLEQLVPNKDKNQLAQKPLSPITSSNCWFVRFVYRDDAIRAFANLKMDSNWTVQWAQNVNVPKKFNLLYRNDNNSDADVSDLDDKSPGSFKFDERVRGRKGSGSAYIPPQSITIDKRSIFVGQLPKESTTSNIKEHFSKYGNIVEVNLIHKPSNTFSFIQFETEEAAAAALEKENHSIFLEKTIHVQYKELGGYHSKRNARRQNSFVNPFPKNSTFGGPQLNLAPPPINMYRRRASDMGPANMFGCAKFNPGNQSPPGPLPYMPMMPPGVGPNGAPGFEPNMYPFMNANFRRGSMPDNWMPYRGEQPIGDFTMGPPRQKRTEKKTEKSNRPTDDPSDEDSEEIESSSKTEEPSDTAQKTSNGKTTSSGSLTVDYKSRVNRQPFTTSRNGSDDSIGFSHVPNPYYAPHYYYPPMPYPMGGGPNQHGSMHNPSFMMMYPMRPPHGGSPGPDSPIVPRNMPMNMKPVGSVPPSSGNFGPFIPPPPIPHSNEEPEYLDY